MSGICKKKPNRRPDAGTVQGLFTKDFNAKVQKANTQKIQAKTRFSRDKEDHMLGTQTQAAQKHQSKPEQEFRTELTMLLKMKNQQETQDRLHLNTKGGTRQHDTGEQNKGN